MKKNEVFNNLLLMQKYFPRIRPVFLILFLLLTGVFAPGYSNNFQSADSLLKSNRKLNAEELIRGERLFYGLVYFEDKAVNCAQCHNTRVVDTLNWNPDAVEISKKYLDKNAADLSKALLKPVGKRMSEAHSDFQFSPEDIILIKGYMDQLVTHGLKENKPVITNLLLFIIAVLLFLFAAADLIITKKLLPGWMNIIILLLASGFITNTIVKEAIALGRSQDYSPLQPIKFSHAIHAGQNGTECIYCHSSAPFSKSAGIPSENVCMNCHLMVRSGTRSGSSEIARVLASYEKQEPTEWIKVHNLPDHVFFSHAQHVTAGNVACQECHGTVEEMDQIVQFSDLSMGWCLDCHRSRKVNFTENDFYTQYKELSEKVRLGTLDSVTVEMIGGRDCMKCHY